MDSPPNAVCQPSVPTNAERERLVEQVRARIGACAEVYASALRSVDRARFVEPEVRELAWLDEPLPLHTPHGRNVATISAPHVYVMAFQALGLARGHHFLELGSGSGYGAALAAAVVGPRGTVTTVEIDPHLARRTARLLAQAAPEVTVLEDDGLARPDLLDTTDRCSLTFAVTALAPEFLARLPMGASLVAPVCVGDEQRLLLFRKLPSDLTAAQPMIEDLGAVRFVASRSRRDLVLERPT